MTPLQLAQNLAGSGDRSDRVLAAAIVTRGLSDDDPSTFRQGWPIEVSATAAVQHLGLVEDAAFVADVLTLAPTLSDAILNKGAVTR